MGFLRATIFVYWALKRVANMRDSCLPRNTEAAPALTAQQLGIFLACDNRWRAVSRTGNTAGNGQITTTKQSKDRFDSAR